MSNDPTKSSERPPRDTLYLQVLVAIALGVIVGVVDGDLGVRMKPLGDAFIRVVKMLIAPVVFCTVTTGIAGAGDLRKVGRVGIKALVYFEVMTTVALLLGMVVVHLVEPGAGMHQAVEQLDASRLTATTHGRENRGLVDHLLGMIPENLASAFVDGEILQVLFVAVLAGLALASMGTSNRPAVGFLEHVSKVLFRVIALVMRAAPIGAFGAMAYTVGSFGAGSLYHLVVLMLCFYATALAFVLVALGAVCRLVGFSIVDLLVHIREELLIVLGTSSSETVLPRLMDKLERLGCSPAIVRLVVPTGYSFNLDGTSIYLTMAALFVAQALDVRLTVGQELGLLAVLLLTSKGAAAVTGGGFVTLAATLQTTSVVPVAGLSLLLGIDRFMSEARALTNLVGNSVAAIVVARWEGALDRDRLTEILARRPRSAAPPG